MKQPTITLAMPVAEYLFTVITARVEGTPGLIEFRGDGIWQWGLNVPHLSRREYMARMPWLRSHRSRICWAEWVHDSLEGWHTCVLHTGGEVAILPRHPDYAALSRIVSLSQRPESEVIDVLLTTGV